MWKSLTKWLSALTGQVGRNADASLPRAAHPAPQSTQPGTATAVRAPLPQATAKSAATPNTAQPSVAHDAADSGPKAPLPPATQAQQKGRYVEHHARGDVYLEERERELLARISARIANGDLELPQLPSTSMAVIDMTSKNSAEIGDIVRLIESDPVLSSEIVKMANSALYSGAEPVDSIAQSVMRIGLRNLRSLMFSLSMRSAVLRDKRLSTYAEEVWRQSYSTASIARGIAKPLGVDPDRAFLHGLLADIGKVSLLAMLRKEIPKGSEVSPALVGRVFYLFHEVAGGRLAEAWHMPADIVAVASCHHRYAENAHNPQDAALVSLALHLDIRLEHPDDRSFDSAVDSPEMEFLKLSAEQRHQALEAAREAHANQMRLV